MAEAAPAASPSAEARQAAEDTATALWTRLLSAMAAKAEGGGRTAEVAEGEVAEGFELVTSHSSGTGFKGVTKLSGRKARPYEARIWKNGSMRHLGIFATAKEAALCYARHVGPERAAAEAAVANVPVPQPLTAEEARAAAVAEGLEFIPSGSMSGTGFRGVKKVGNKYVGDNHRNRAATAAT